MSLVFYLKLFCYLGKLSQKEFLWALIINLKKEKKEGGFNLFESIIERTKFN